MNYLIELVACLKDVKANPLSRVLLEPGSKMERLFDLINEGQVQSDEEAAAKLYGGADGMPRYRSLKNKLKDRLVKGLFLLDSIPGNNSSRQDAFYECNQKWAAAQKLTALGAHSNGIHVMEKLLRQTRRFEFTEISTSILRHLRLHYGTENCDPEKFFRLNAQYQEHVQLWQWEARAEEFYTQLTIKYVNDKSTKAEISGLARQYYEEVQPWLEQSDAFKLHLMGRLLQIAIYTSVNDYRQTALLCEDAIAFFEQKPFESRLPLQVFYYQLAICYIQLRDFEKGQALLQKHLGIFAEGSFNWFKFRELFFLLAMHTGHYAEGARVCAQILDHTSLSAQPAHVVEMWKIYDAFVHLLRRMGKIAEAETVSGAAVSRFRLIKFINEIPVYSKDKRGMNIPILLLQIMFLVVNHKHDQLLDRIEAIEKYRSRYLRQNDTFRSNVFIKMLMQVPLTSFQKDAVQRKTDKLLQLLLETPLEIAGQRYEVEIIPYEMLWSMLLEHLNSRPGSDPSNA